LEVGRSAVIFRDLCDMAARLVADNKGLLAIDESNATCNKRFAVHGIPQTEEMRRAYRELILTTPGLSASISGAILYDETIHQATTSCIPFVRVLTDAGIIPGVKVDIGVQDLAGHPAEKVTEGLDGLRPRLQHYSKIGARFAKWRAVFVLEDSLPTKGCIEANAQALARYAALCQEAGLVPIVADGRKSQPRTLCFSHRRRPENGLQAPPHARCAARRNDPQAQYGASWNKCFRPAVG
jgi:fructose-bisphosphate aldolase class I